MSSGGLHKSLAAATYAEMEKGRIVIHSLVMMSWAASIKNCGSLLGFTCSLISDNNK